LALTHASPASSLPLQCPRTAPGEVRSDPSTMRAATKTLAARSRAQHSRAASWSAVVSGRTGRRWRSTLTDCPSRPAVSRRGRERRCAILVPCTLRVTLRVTLRATLGTVSGD
jgi:hypothetical protein